MGLGVVVDASERRRAEIVHVEGRVEPVIVNPDGEAGPLLLPARQDVARNGGREFAALMR